LVWNYQKVQIKEYSELLPPERISRHSNICVHELVSSSEPGPTVFGPPRHVSPQALDANTTLPHREM